MSLSKIQYFILCRRLITWRRTEGQHASGLCMPILGSVSKLETTSFGYMSSRLQSFFIMMNFIGADALVF
jgi:hypothetical protein